MEKEIPRWKHGIKIVRKGLNHAHKILRKYIPVIVIVLGLLVVSLIGVLDDVEVNLCGDLNFKIGKILEVLLAYGAIVVVYLEIRQNKQISEAQLVKDINSEFINNESLSMIEHQLEIYYSQYMAVKEDDEKKKNLKLDLNLDTESYQRQYLVNYLVHLEAVASLVNANILRLNVINELVAYRFFIAMNNPEIQKLELEPYWPFYMGCYKLHKKWTENMKKLEKEMREETEDNNLSEMIPMEEYGDFFDKQQAKVKKWKK